MSDKQTVMELLQRLPDDVALKDIKKEIEFLAAVREGDEQADRGEVVSHEQVKKEFASCLSRRGRKTVGANFKSLACGAR
jgi:hypothetical protein